MGEKDTIIKEKLKYSGLGNFKEAYEFASEWLKDEGFSVTEKEYKEKVSGDSKEIEINWEATKKISDYFKFIFGINWRILNMKDVEVEIDGKKKQMNKFGELSLDFKGTLEKDYSNKWSGTAMNRFFKDPYHKFVIPGRIEEKSENARNSIIKFKEEMKAFFELTGKR